MEGLFAFLDSSIHNAGQAKLVFVTLVTVAFFAFGTAVAVVVMGISSPLRQRLAKLTDPAAQSTGFGAHLARMFRPVHSYILPAAEKERSKIQEQLVQGGFRDKNALTVFYSIKTALAIVLPAAALVAAPFFPELSTSQVMFFTMLAAGIGVSTPNVFLRHAVEKRKKLLRHGFPDALDLLVVCVESGLGLAAAIQRVADELVVSHPELAEELIQVNSEMRAGIERSIALKNLALRTGLDDIRGLVTLLSQSMRFGTSIADTLRIYADEFRDKRMQRAEEKAAKIGTMLIFPLVLCLFPAFFVVAVGPAILKVLQAVGRI